MLGLELVVILGAAVLAGNVLARRLRVAPPVLLLLTGVLLGFVPALYGVQLPPEVVLLLFLPPLLYWGSLTTSLREIRTNLRGVILTGTVLVIVTAAAAAAAARALGMPWGPAWVLGAVVAPTDATAVGALARILPRRDLTLLRAESLINDGTALVIYGLAVGVTVGEEQFSLGRVGWLFLLAYAGGAAAGAVVAWLGLWVRGRLTDPVLATVAMLLIPFVAFLLAEAIHASGVVAVVVCGLIMSQSGPRVSRAEGRLQTQAFYTVTTFLLNGSLFVLIGLELHPALRGLTSLALTRALIDVGVVFAVLVGVRFAFLFASASAARLLDRRSQRRPLRESYRARAVSAVAGFRGAVSLAAAIAVPNTIASGAPFPYRDTIIFVTAGVVVMTLVLKGIMFPIVVRWARLPHDTEVRDERRLAETLATEEALDALPELAAELDTDPAAAERLRHEYETHLLIVRADGTEVEPAVQRDRDYTALRLALLARKRAVILRLRDEHRIDDTVLRQLQAALDMEEIRLSRRHPD
ncbi:Na+/H+ antiporter [Nonomuraea sediminis]|uniref:Na+/H+ antiporter n=1 Tax=Nonomuraea sediminis TaxID=2835864 RepID=UPI001BDC14D8|nr:Na+/H+ antiporter [Nonomuraea sediminis]